jgi:hypothetical protein
MHQYINARILLDPLSNFQCQVARRTTGTPGDVNPRRPQTICHSINSLEEINLTFLRLRREELQRDEWGLRLNTAVDDIYERRHQKY